MNTPDNDSILARHRETWNQKKIIRIIYSQWYRQILADMAPGKGKTIELGGGSGNFKEFYEETVTSDIEYCPWLDVCFDAHQIPFKDKHVGNLVLIDVLHHLAGPIGFFKEAARVLESGGRIILLEPFPSLFSLPIYKRVHPEPFIMDKNYFQEEGEQKNETEKDPWEANQAIAYLLFFKHKKQFSEMFADSFRMIKRKPISCILYPASGGFENKAMIPDSLIPIFKFLEICCTPFRRLLAFRCYMVLERK